MSKLVPDKTPEQWQAELTWLYKLCARARSPITQRYEELQALDAELATLQGNTCTGKVSWRDTNNPNPNAAKMTIVHGTNQACPLHGEPANGKRIRSYVGTDPHKQAQAIKAIEDETRREKLQHKRDGLEAAIRDAGYALKDFYRTLGWSTPWPNQPDKHPEPNSDWAIPGSRRCQRW